MNDDTLFLPGLSPVERHDIHARFDGGALSSDGGVLLLRQADHLLGLSEAVSKALGDRRRQASCVHDGLSLLKQRVYG